MPKTFSNLRKKWPDCLVKTLFQSATHHWSATVPGLLARSSLLVLLLATASVAATSYSEGKKAYLAKDYSKALAILHPLAEQGDSNAQVMLGLMYDYGHGVKADQEQAVDWYTRAARQGLPVVQHDLGVKYFQGKGIKRDYGQAARWWQMAADAGLADSQFNLGLMYYRGLGVDQDLNRAAGLFQQAADQGHANAQYSLAVMYAFSQGLEQDYSTALKLFRQAAAENNAQAQYNLGVFYENGYGVEKNLEQARAWYRKAAEQNVVKAAERLKVLTDNETAAAMQTASATEVDSSNVAAVQTASNSAELRRDSWVRNQSAEQYTIQLISLTDEQAVRKYLQDNALTDNGGYIEVMVNSTRRYNAIYGDYASHESAQAAITALPASVQKVKPWVRNFSVLQKIMQSSAAVTEE